MQSSNLINKKFGHLLVISRYGTASDGHSTWLCKCDCGQKKVVASNNLRQGGATGCGCFRIKHGHCKKGQTSKTYSVWSGIIQRCNNPNNKEYKNYGGRGIHICKRWLKFENFLEDMGEQPLRRQINRINNNLGYYKKNCEWTTAQKQARNKRNNRLLIFKGRTQCVSAWAKETKIHLQTFWRRVNSGWSIEKILTTPIRKIRNKK